MTRTKKIHWWSEKSVWIMLFLGFSAGIPILLIFSTLSLWLTEAGVEKSAVTYFSWAALGYSFKFVWAPLIDKIPLPILTQLLGRRRGWLLLSQLAVIGAIIWMALIDPQVGLTAMAFAAVLLGFSSATQDVVIDAFRVESADPRLQAMLSSTYVAGYRIAMQMFAGAAALYLADYLGSSVEHYRYEAWRTTYFFMASLMLVGVVTTLLVAEPNEVSAKDYPYSTQDYLRFFLVFLFSIIVFIAVLAFRPEIPEVFVGYKQTVLSFVYGAVSLILGVYIAFRAAKLCLKFGFVNAQMVYEGYQAPMADFMQRYGKLAIWVLLLIGFYRISDIVMGVITNVFYIDMGYSKSQIASVTKIFGVVVTIAGSFLGGLLALRFGVMRVLMLGAVLVAITNLVFVWLANIGGDYTSLNLPILSTSGLAWVSLPKELTIAIIIDNLAQGIAIAAFIAWLSSLTNVSFTATQYAIFSSLMTLFPKLIGGYSGTLVEHIGYANFFLVASCLGLPVIILIYFLRTKLVVSK